MRRSSACSCPRSSMSRSKVSSVEMEMRSTWVSSPRSSIPRARSRSSAPTLPGSSRSSAASSSSARSPIVVDARPRAAAPPPGARPREQTHVEGRQERRLAARPHDREAAGLSPVGRHLRDHLAGGDAERAGQRGRAADGRLHRFGELAGARKSPAISPGRGSPRRSRSARRSGRPHAPCPRPPASTRGTGHDGGGRRPRPDSGAAPRRSSSPSGCRAGARRSSRWRPRRGPSGLRRRPGVFGAGRDPRAARRRRRRHRDRGARRSPPPRVEIGAEPTHARAGMRGTIAVGARGYSPTQGGGVERGRIGAGAA